MQKQRVMGATLLWKTCRLLTSPPIIRRYAREKVRQVKTMLGCPDAMADLLAVCRHRRPAAILDIGAHVGHIAVRFAEQLPGVPIHAFEPSPASAAEARRRAAPFPNVHVHQVAISNQNGSLQFHLNQESQTNSLLDNGPGNKQVYSELTSHVQAIEVESIRLDDWIRKHVPEGMLVMKVDVQGAEGLLVEGGLETLKHRTLAFYCETALCPLYEGEPHLMELNERLGSECGLVLSQIYPCHQDQWKQALYTDALWIRPNTWGERPAPLATASSAR